MRRIQQAVLIRTGTEYLHRRRTGTGEGRQPGRTVKGKDTEGYKRRAGGTEPRAPGP